MKALLELSENEYAMNEREQGASYFWSIYLSDGMTKVDLKPDGFNLPVAYDQRIQYVQEAL